MSETEVPDDLIGHKHEIERHLESGNRPVDGRVREHTFEITINEVPDRW